MSLRYRCSLGNIEFTDVVLEVFQKNRQTRSWSREAGGQLFCRFVGATVFIERATNPGGEDKRNRYSFWPSRKKEQREIDDLFACGQHYIGDWHTHPQTAAMPSSEDIRKIRSIFGESEHILKFMVLVIVGQKSDELGLCVGVVTSLGLERCTLG